MPIAFLLQSATENSLYFQNEKYFELIVVVVVVVVVVFLRLVFGFLQVIKDLNFCLIIFTGGSLKQSNTLR